MHRFIHSLLVFVLVVGIAACQSDSPPTAPIPDDPVVLSDPEPPGSDGSQAGERGEEPGPPSPNDEEPDAEDDPADHGSDASEEKPEPAPEPGGEPGNPDTTGQTDPGEQPGEPANNDDPLAALNDELDRELARLNSLVPDMLDLYLDLLTNLTEALLQDTGELLACTPLPFAFDADIIGPAGGTLVVGPHSLSIPAGALDHPVVIVAQSIPSLNVEIGVIPHGLSFERPVALTLSYDHCGDGLLGAPLDDILDGDSSYRIVYIDSNGQLHELPSTDDKLRKQVTGSLEHFSRYAIAR